MEIEHCWEHQGREVLKFATIDSIDDAKPLVGAWVEIGIEDAVPLPEGAYWDHDLIGCSVSDDRSGRLGTVVDVLRIAGNSQLVVRGGGGEFLVPFAAGICLEVSIPRREIRVDLPEGLVDLNK